MVKEQFTGGKERIYVIGEEEAGSEGAPSAERTVGL